MRECLSLKCSSLLAIVAIAFLSGCETQWNTYGVFSKPELIHCERFALFGLDTECEQIFMSYFVRAFPDRSTTFVERSRLTDVISEQDLLAGRLDDKTRAQLGKIYGVQAIILCEYRRWQDFRARLQVRILDTETAAIIGSAVVDGNGQDLNTIYFSELAERAIQAIKIDLTKS